MYTFRGILYLENDLAFKSCMTQFTGRNPVMFALRSSVQAMLTACEQTTWCDDQYLYTCISIVIVMYLFREHLQEQIPNFPKITSSWYILLRNDDKIVFTTVLGLMVDIQILVCWVTFNKIMVCHGKNAIILICRFRDL